MIINVIIYGVVYVKASRLINVDSVSVAVFSYLFPNGYHVTLLIAQIWVERRIILRIWGMSELLLIT
jgi:hypothetical protein